VPKERQHSPSLASVTSVQSHLRRDLPQDLWIDRVCWLHAHIARRVGAEVAVVVCGGGVCGCVGSCDLILAPRVTRRKWASQQGRGDRGRGFQAQRSSLLLAL
jgi:hypothetical protein